MKREVLVTVVAIAATVAVLAILEIKEHTRAPGPTTQQRGADPRASTAPVKSPISPPQAHVSEIAPTLPPGPVAKGSVAAPAPPPASEPGVKPQRGAAPSAAPAAVTKVSAPADPPSIVSVWLSPSIASAGQTVSGTVVTSSNVASVEARIGGYAASLAKVGVGEFHLNYSVPNLPPILRRTYSIEVIARNARGDETTAQTSISIR